MTNSAPDIHLLIKFSFLMIALLLLSVGVFIYLFYALVKPEKF